MPMTTGMQDNDISQTQIEKIKDSLKQKRKIWAEQKTLGERTTIPRDGKPGVQAIVYWPKNLRESNEASAAGGKKLPVIFNMHGGAWVGGYAILMDSFCRLLADELPAMVVNINYTKADVEPFPYQHLEIADTVRYFAAHSDVYGIDPTKMVLGGHSAGAHLACGTALLLARKGFSLAAQMLVYPVADLTTEDKSIVSMLPLLLPNGGWDNPIYSPVKASKELLGMVAPAIFVLCGKDSLREYGIKYAYRLMEAGTEIKVREYRSAEHGFLEVNQPSYTDGDDRQTPEQEIYARDAEQYIINELRAMLIEK